MPTAIPHSHRATNELALSLVQQTGKLGGDILDLGAGNGYFSNMLANAAEQKKGEGHIEACDMVDDGFSAQGVKFTVCDVNHRLPYSDSSFDAVVAIEVLEHTRLAYGVLSEINRILKPNGLIVFSVPNVGHLVSRFNFLIGGHYQLYPSPSAVPEKGGHICGHISPFPFQYWHYGLRSAGFSNVKLHQDRTKKSAAFFATIFGPLLKWSTTRRLAQLSRDVELFEETQAITKEANSWPVLTSRSLVFSASK